MIELELLGIGADGESLVFTAPSGERYTTPITDELRGALRRERPRLDVAPDPQHSLKPSQIQTLLRGGLTAEDIACEYQMDLDLIQRFESPVQAEKDYILQRAKNVRLGAEPGGPRLGDLVVDRLATRGVSPSSVLWYASRQVDSPWEISLTFLQGAAEYAAHWRFDAASSSLEAVDQEARWLTETTSQAAFSTIFPPLASKPAEPVSDPEAAADLAQREALLDQLNAARGKRVDIAVESDEDDDVDAIMAELEKENTPDPAPASISARIYSLAQAKTKRDIPEAESAPSDTSDEVSVTTSSIPDTLPGLDQVAEETPAPKKRTKRRSVPSWDEIVFGSKP